MKEVRGKWVLLVILFLVVSFMNVWWTGSSSAQAKGEVFKIKFQSSMGAGEKYRIDRLVKNIEESSGGRIDIDLYLGGEIFPFGEELTAVGEGLIDMAQGTPSFYKDVIPVAGVEAGFPFMCFSQDSV